MRPRWRVLARAAAWPLAPALLASALAMGAVYDEGSSSPDITFVPVLAAMVACWLLGVLVTGRSFEQRAGWAFLGLGSALAWTAAVDEYARLAVLAHRDLPGGRVAATLSDTSWIWWFVFLALVVQYTVPAVPGRLTRVLPRATLLAGATFQLLALPRTAPLGDPAYKGMVSPWAIETLGGPINGLAAATAFAVGACVVASVVVLVRSWRRSSGEPRQQLLWLVAGAIPVAPAVVGAFAASWAGHDDVSLFLLGCVMLSLVGGAGLSVLAYRLYEVEQVVTESAAYAIASISVVVAFGGVLFVVSRSSPVDAVSQVATIAATLIGVVVARASYVWALRAVGRRVNRARYDAVATVRRGLAEAVADLDGVIAAALGSRAHVLYPAGDGAWVTADGRSVPAPGRAIDVRRHGQLTALIGFDPMQTERGIAEAVAREAAAEIHNVALRAELARQVEVVTESRARLATAHLEERRRIERDLHDGAQQRLLAIALQLRSARLNGDDRVLATEADRAIEDLQLTVQELRDLAAGLQPAALAGGGLLAAVTHLATRAPVTVRYDVPDRRLPTEIEGGAWFVIAEAVTNAVKHAQVDEVAVTVETTPELVRVVVVDEGVGSANQDGSGLQGLTDRVEALGGTLHVLANEPCGTRVEAVFPCAS
jgi:signal transduction histidine kinase